jgi:hypothetical protein
MRLFKWFVGSIAVVLLSLAVMVPAALAAEVDLRAHLHGAGPFPNAIGTSEYDRGGGERDVSVTVNRLGRIAGHRVNFFVAGQKIGSAVVSSTGRVHIERETDHGQFVPFASAGSKVSVKHAGVVIAIGTYFRERDND